MFGNDLVAQCLTENRLIPMVVTTCIEAVEAAGEYEAGRSIYVLESKKGPSDARFCQAWSTKVSIESRAAWARPNSSLPASTVATLSI